MEGSEEDAGGATNASRRALAREKDIGGSENSGTSGADPPEPAEAGTASETTSMSEFDGDSVPSPSQCNTSTEAILDMIDEIVDGPDANRRRSRHSDEQNSENSSAQFSERPTEKQDPIGSETNVTSQQPCSPSASSVNNETHSLQKSSETKHTPPHSPTLDASAPTDEKIQTSTSIDQSESLSESEKPESALQQSCSSDTQEECTTNYEQPISQVVTEQIQQNCSNETQSATICENVPQSQEVIHETPVDCPSQNIDPELSQASSSASVHEAAESTLPEEISTVCTTPQGPSDCAPPNIPSSSVLKTVPSVSDTNNSEVCERTIKCASSSDSRDNITVESAESTSSDVCVSETRTITVESSTRSPLRRRLVRPTTCDRRPDSTVSSTEDTQVVNVHTTEQSPSDNIAKDVSSSSDTVPQVHGNVEPREIRSLSEISVCQAETSVNSPKKIKLIRQKVPLTPVQTKNICEIPKLTRDTDQCQSTSAEIVTQPSTSAEIVVQPLPESICEDNNSSKTPKCDSPDVRNDCSPKLSLSSSEQKLCQQPSESKQVEVKSQESCSISRPSTPVQETVDDQNDLKKVPPIKLNLHVMNTDSSQTKSEKLDSPSQSKPSSETVKDISESTKQVPKLTIKLGNIQPEEVKSPIPKLTIKPIRAPENNDDERDTSEVIPSVTKLNIKPIPKPAEKVNDIHRKSSSSEISESESSENDESNSTSDHASASDQGSSEVVPKVTIKLGKPGTQSEGKFYTEPNVPKLTIKGLQHNDYEEKDSPSKLKVVISQSEEKQVEKIPKLTIKTISKSEGQPLSPKLTIKPIKPPENLSKDNVIDQYENQDKLISTETRDSGHIPKLTIKPIIKTDESSSKTPKKGSTIDGPEHIPVVTKLNIKPIVKPVENVTSENVPTIPKLHIKPIVKPADSGENAVGSIEDNVPAVSKLNIKPVIKPPDTTDTVETTSPVLSKLNIKPIVKSAHVEETPEDVVENIPVVSKLIIKPLVKPTENVTTDESEGKVPVVSKLNIKPIIKPKDSEAEDSVEDVPKVTKLNIKPLKEPEAKSLVVKDCDESNANTEESSIPVVMKLNIKPIVKPVEEETLKDSGNQSSETGNSSDDNGEHIPVVTKLNIKPIVKPDYSETGERSSTSNEDNVPVVTKLNIKPLIKPEENKSPLSPKKDGVKITKLNIKPIVKPDESEQHKTKSENEESAVKHPPLLMKINMKAVADITPSNDCHGNSDKKVNSVADSYNNSDVNVPKVSKLNIKPITKPLEADDSSHPESLKVNCNPSSSHSTSMIAEILKQNCSDLSLKESNSAKAIQSKMLVEDQGMKQLSNMNKSTELVTDLLLKTIDRTDKLKNVININTETDVQTSSRQHSQLQNYTLLKKLLETKKDGLDNRLQEQKINAKHSHSTPSKLVAHLQKDSRLDMTSPFLDSEPSRESNQEKTNEIGSIVTSIASSILDTKNEPNESVTKPLEINVSDKINTGSGQDSPRIILKINKTDHGPSAKIITEEPKRPDTPQDAPDNTHEMSNDKQNIKKNLVNSRKKTIVDTPNETMGKRLRSSRVVEGSEKTTTITPRKNAGKRPSATEVSPTQVKDPELSVLETKRLKLGQLLSNKSLTITPMPLRDPLVSPTKPAVDTRPAAKTVVNHTLLNNENCSKNGNSKLHNILSNLQAKQAQALALNDLNCAEKKSSIPELDSNTSTGSSDVIEIIPIENSRPEMQEMIINENSESRDFTVISDDVSQDPLEGVETSRINLEPVSESSDIAKIEQMTPQPKKRGRPRKLPVSEGAKPTQPVLPVPALEERPQRSLRLSRDRPAILVKTRGRGRGRGAKRLDVGRPSEEPAVETSPTFHEEPKPIEEIDPTSSRIKLPRMTEALDKMPSTFSTPLSTRRRKSSTTEGLRLFGDTPELKVVLNTIPQLDEVLTSPEPLPTSGRGSRGGRYMRGRGRSPRGTYRGRGRGRGGGRGAMYMKETMGIYGRVCGPATTTVELFEEETCMMDDNATPAKPLHLLDEDSQSSVKSSTNESSKMKKSKFADLFDSNKVWTAADVKEYMWPPPERPDGPPQVMMVQEQVAMFLGVKSFKRRYPELKRRAIVGEEKDYLLSKGLVTEALCDLGVTAVDASEVLDIMLSDYPHKYEEYRSHQHQRQIAEAAAVPEPEEPTPTVSAEEVKLEPRIDRVEMKVETKAESKPEPSKIDLEKTRLEMAAAAIASASEFNARLNASRRGACVDLQTLTIQRRRPLPTKAPIHVQPPGGFYPHALLPGQYQHCYRVYTSEQLRYFPLNTVTAAPPAPPSPAPSSSESEGEWSSSASSDDSARDRAPAKRKKLVKTKRSSQAEPTEKKEESKEGEVDLCRSCNLRLEANRKYTHERFLVCANCNAKLHPGCVDLSADTIRKCREYPWQCAECKSCCACRKPQDDDKMLFCDLCDRGFHIYCVGLDKVPSGRWHCVECAICKSCGARDPNGPQAEGSVGVPGTPGTPSGSITVAGGGEWHHQTRRGPGGHKVYSHSLCTPCARAYRIGRYCPLCERSFIGPKGTMQLVICKLCDRQHHQDCVRQTVSQLNVLDYTCGECKRGGITSRAAAVRLAPRTIATLFMAKRRFNKYAHRQYMQNRKRGTPKGSHDSNDADVDGETSCEPISRAEEASDASEAEAEVEAEAETCEVSDPLEGVGDEPPVDETAAAVNALQMDFGD